MSIPKVYLNKNGYVEKIELPDGTISKRNYGLLPDFMVLADYEKKEIEIYNNEEVKIKDCLLLSVNSYNMKYDVLREMGE